MIGRNKTWLDNIDIQEQLVEAFEEGYISEDDFDRTKATYPDGYYNPNFFVALGLFLLTAVIVSFAFGLFSLIFITTQSTKLFGIGAMLFGILTYTVLEVAIKRTHYRSGVDTALLWISPVLIITGLNLAFDVSAAWNAMLVFGLAVYATIRFADALMGVVGCVALLYWCLVSYSGIGQFAKATSPFIIMSLAAIIFFLARQRRESFKFRHYKNCLTLIEITTLICFYAACNYYVVREAGSSMFHWHLVPGESIPFGWLFWILTALVPLSYLWVGIRRKDLLLIRVGLVVLAAMILTIRYYYHVISGEMSLVVGGILLAGSAWSLIRYLKEPKFGYTYREITQSDTNAKRQLESLVMGSMAVTTQTQSSGGTQFGGGTGSGGGAGGSF